MNMLKVSACSICGEPRPGNQPWILVTEDRWQDKLRILHWDDYLAAQESTHCACSAAHLQELVVHWMTREASIIRLPSRIPGRRSRCASGGTGGRRETISDP